MGSRRHDRIDRGPCPRGLCEHTAAMHVEDGHFVVCDAKRTAGEKGELPCALRKDDNPIVDTAGWL